MPITDLVSFESVPSACFHESSWCGTITWRWFSAKPGCDPIELIPKGAVDNRIVPEAGVNITLDARSGTAKALKHLSAGRFREQDVVPSSNKQQWTMGRLHSRLIACEKLFDVLVASPAR